MKNTIRTVIVMSILLVGVLVNAKNVDPKPAMKVQSVNAEKFTFSMKEVKHEALLLIKDVYGFVIYFEDMKAGTKLQKTYNISSLPAGTYYLEIIADGYSKEYLVKKAYNELLVEMDIPTYNINEKMLAVL